MGAGDIRTRVKSAVGDAGVQRVRSLGRFRYLAKVNAVRSSGMRFRADPAMLTRYVLLDPEFDNFTYELDNGDELVATLAELTGRPADELAGYLREPAEDPALTSELSRRLRWRVDVKHPPPLGRRYSWYVLARALKPELVVESGTQDGLGSLALLRALERNGQEGRPGRLLSIDTLATAGWMVPTELRAGWELAVGSADQVLAERLPGRRVGLFVEDTGAPERVVRAELETVLAHAADELVVAGGNTGHLLAAGCREHGVPSVVHRDRARRHFFDGAPTTFARVAG